MKCMNCEKHLLKPDSPWCEKCQKEMNEWVDQPNQSSAESSIQKTKKIDFTQKIQNIELESTQKQSPTISRIEKSDLKKTEPDTTQTKKNETNSEPNGLETIRSANLNTNEITTTKTKSNFTESSMLPEIVGTQLEVFTENSDSLKKEVSRSINLLNQSENELFSSMKGLRSSQPDPIIRLYEPERVQTAVLCGRQIVESMKTKLEMLKFFKEL